MRTLLILLVGVASALFLVSAGPKRPERSLLDMGSVLFLYCENDKQGGGGFGPIPFDGHVQKKKGIQQEGNSVIVRSDGTYCVHLQFDAQGSLNMRVTVNGADVPGSATGLIVANLKANDVIAVTVKGNKKYRASLVVEKLD